MKVDLGNKVKDICVSQIYHESLVLWCLFDQVEVDLGTRCLSETDFNTLLDRYDIRIPNGILTCTTWYH